MAPPPYNGYPGQYESGVSAAKRAAINAVLGRDDDKLRWETVNQNEIEKKRYEEWRKAKKAKEDEELVAELFDFVKGTGPSTGQKKRRVYGPPKDHGNGSKR